MEKYTDFLDNQLKVDYLSLLKKSENLEKELDDYEELERWILGVQASGGQPFKTLLNVAEDLFLKAKIENKNKIGLAIGFGFFLECSYPEALKIIAKKKPLLEKKIAENEEKIAKVFANIHIFENTLDKVTIGLSSEEQF